MLKRYLEQRHIDLDSGRSCLALERETGKHLKSWPMKTAGTTGVISSTCGYYQTNLKTYLWPVMCGRW